MIERGRGVFVKGEKSGMAKLNNHQVIVIRELRAEGLKQREIAMVVGCSRSAVSNVLNGRAWRHVQEASS
jgi:transcriptional regulator